MKKKTFPREPIESSCVILPKGHVYLNLGYCTVEISSNAEVAFTDIISDKNFAVITLTPRNYGCAR